MQPAAVLAAVVKVQGVKSANVALAGFNTNLERTDTYAASAAASSAKAGKIMKGAMTVGAVAVAYGLTKAVSAGAKFERGIDTLGAIAETSGKKLEKVEKQALKLGESTQYTANQVVEAQSELVKGGLTLEQTYGGGIQAALSLAAAGGLELGEAAEYTVNAMKLFGLSGKESKHVADLFAIAANKTTADVQDFGMAMKQGGSIAKIAGYNITETTTTLEALAEAGIKNSDAGTSMKTSIIQLLKPSTKQKAMAEELNIVWTTQEGKLKNAAELSEQLHKATDGMTDAERAKTLATLAGTDGVRTLSSLYQKTPKQLEAMEKGLEKTGVAEKIASERMNNLSGDAEQLMGAMETAGIKIEQALAPALRTATQGMTEAVIAVTNFDYSGAIEEAETFFETNEQAQMVAVGFEEAQSAAETAFEWIGQNGPGIWSEVSAGTVEAAETIKNTAGPVIEELMPIWKQAADGLLQMLEGEWQAIKGIFNKDPGQIAGGIGKMFGGALKVAGAYLQQVGVEIKNVGKLLGVIFAPEIHWIEDAYNNTKDWLTTLLPVKIGLAYISPVISQFIGFLGVMIKLFGNSITIMRFAATMFGSVLSAAVRIAMAIVSAFMTNFKNFMRVVGDVVSFVSAILHGEWGRAWHDAGKIVTDWVKFVLGVLKGMWTVIKTVFSSGFQVLTTFISSGWHAVEKIFVNTAEALGGAFDVAWGTITGLFEQGLQTIESVINSIIDVINLIPGVNIGHVGAGGEKKSNKGSTTTSKAHESKGGGAYAEGGKVNKPIAIMGEEAPRHHEWVIASNPAYKKANLGYWAAAGADLGVPGFASGGLFGTLGDLGGDALGALKKGAEYSPAGLALKGAKSAFSYGKELVGKGAGYLIGKLPTPDLPFPFDSAAEAADVRAKEYIENWFGSDKAKKYKQVSTGISGPEGTMGAESGPNGTATYKGITMAIWIKEALEYAAGKGVTPQPTSGYRSHAQNVAEGRNYYSEHEKTRYPGGAVDFGSFTTGLIPKMEAVHATADFKYPLLAPIGFEDDGHASGTGHAKGGLLWEGIRQFYEGGAFTPATGAQQEHALHVARRLVSKGLNYKGASGVTGNAWRESHWEPSSEGTGGGGLWGFTTSPISLADLKAAGGSNWTDLDFQTDFMWDGPVPASGLKSALNASNTAAAAAQLFDSEWEHSGVKAMSERMDGAREVMRLLGGAGVKLGEDSEETEHESNLKTRKQEAEQKQREGKARKAGREVQLKHLKGLEAEQKTLPSQRAKLWNLIGFWGRNGIFDKPGREHVLDSVRGIAADPNIQHQVASLRSLEHWIEENGDLTGKEPNSYKSISDAIDKAKEQGQTAQEKIVEKQKARAASKRAKQVARLESKGQFPGLTEHLKQMAEKVDQQEEIAGQMSALRPDNVGDDYVHGESASWEGILDTLGGWRNTILSDTPVANKRISQIETELNNIEILKPHKGRIQPEAWTRAYKHQKWKIPPLEKALEEAKGFRDNTLTEEMAGVSPQTPKGFISPLPRNPVAGMFGGKIFDVQNTIRELGLPREAATEAEEQADSAAAGEPEKTPAEEAAERAALAKLEYEAEQAVIWRKRFEATQYQSEVIKNFPTPQQLGSLPGYALGGMPSGPSWVGERGKELFYPESRGTVVSARESSEITRDQAGGVVIHAINIHEDGSASVDMGDGNGAQPATVKKVTRKQVRDSMAITPGGTTR